ncbi:MAG: thiamine-phosphate kinase [Actinobacteria bacterium]|nr:thiamine-phosphate kinase [Actinomycetota bacterium]
MRISETGEFGLIDRLRQIVGEPGEGEVWVGDDAAVLRAPAGTILFTTDLMIEGVHFDLEITGPEDLGYKALAVNISDVAAMGGTPRRALVSLGLRPQMETEWVERLYRGMRECADQFDMAIAGGDISRSDCLLLSVALLGNPAGRLVIERKGARVGDVICVTGTLGESAAGYRLLRAGIKERADLKDRHLRPTPRVKEVEILRRQLPTAMIDVSDGFAADLSHLCEQSEVGAIVRSSDLPLVDLTDVELDRDPLELGLHGGEDYELIFTIPADRADEALSKVTRETKTAVTVVGEIVEGRGMALVIDGEESELEARGWDHLRT